MDAFVVGTVVLTYANPRTGSPAPGAKRLKNATVTHQSGRRRVLVEPERGDDGWELPLTPGCFTVVDSFAHEGKFSLVYASRELRCTLFLCGARPADVRALAACVRSGKPLDPKAAREAAAARAGSSSSSSSSAAAGPRPAPAPVNHGYSLLGRSVAQPAAAAAPTTAAAPAPRPGGAAAAAAPAGGGGMLKPAGKPPSYSIVSTGKPAAAGSSSLSASAASSAASAPAPPPAAAPALSAEQQAVVDAAVAGKSLFFTGSAGTGKSLVLHTLRRVLHPGSTAFTASTAVAAWSIGGCTVHSFAGVLVAHLQAYAEGTMSLADVVAQVRRRRDAVMRWQGLRALVVDEVSMLSASDFDVLEAVARGVRENPSPFGGVQVVLSGDFFQLPSVCKDAGAASGKRYAFSSKAWRAVVGDRCMELTQVFRQADAAFVAILNELRWGRVSSGAVEALRARHGAAVAGAAASSGSGAADGAVVATKLHTHRATVDAENRAELARLPTPPVTHRASDTLAGESASQSLLDASVPAPRELTLKVGAQVLLLKTLDQGAGLVNGARGVVTHFVGVGKIPVVRFVSGVEAEIRHERFAVEVGGRAVAVRMQLPLDLAWAISIHKAQGQTLDAVEVDLSRTFEFGQAYVALSRARSLAGLTLKDRFEPGCVRAHPDVVAFYSRMREAADSAADATVRQAASLSSAAPSYAAVAAQSAHGGGGGSRRPSLAGSIGGPSVSRAAAATTVAAAMAQARREATLPAGAVAATAASVASSRASSVSSIGRASHASSVVSHARAPSAVAAPATAATTVSSSSSSVAASQRPPAAVAPVAPRQPLRPSPSQARSAAVGQPRQRTLDAAFSATKPQPGPGSRRGREALAPSPVKGGGGGSSGDLDTSGAAAAAAAAAGVRSPPSKAALLGSPSARGGLSRQRGAAAAAGAGAGGVGSPQGPGSAVVRVPLSPGQWQAAAAAWAGGSAGRKAGGPFAAAAAAGGSPPKAPPAAAGGDAAGAPDGVARALALF